MAVNRPTNVAQKEADINRKLQFYGIYSAFANGKAPSNQQIDVALNSALASKALASPSPKLSEEGKKLVADLRDVIEKAKILLLTKNDGNLLQDFIWQTQNISADDASKPKPALDKATAQQHGNQALDGLRTLGTLVISNGQFRKLLSDATVLLRDMAGDAAAKAADKVNPSDEQLAQIDKPAEDNTWHEVPSVSELKANAKDVVNKNTPLSKKDVKDAAGDATAAAHPSGSRDPEDAARAAAQDQQQGTSSVDGAGGAQTGLQSLKDKASSNIPDETKENARKTAQVTKDKTKNYLSEKMPQERREQTIWRLKKMIVEIQGHSDYQQAIETLLNLAEEYAGHATDLHQQTVGTVKDAHKDDSLKTAEKDLKTLIERFANSTSADDLIDSINTIYRDAEKDPELRNWFKRVDAYIRKCLQQQGYVLEDASSTEWNEIYDKGNFLLRERYRDHTNHIVDEFQFMGNQFNEDPHNRAFADSMQTLFTDLGQDANGKATFKPHLVKDLVNVIIPGAFESLSYVPVPRIEYSDPQFDAIIENLVLESDNLFPNSLEISNDNYFKMGRKAVASSNKTKIMIAASGIQMDLKDVAYYVHKKQGFPSLKDKGVMDIFMGGEGFGFKAALETADKSDKNHFFKVNTIHVDVKHLKLKMKQSSHKLLFNIFTPLLITIMKPVITKVIEVQIRKYINDADAYCYKIQKEVEKGVEAAKNDPENAQNIFSRYVQAIQANVQKGKDKANEAANAVSDKKANVAMTQYDSMFKNIKLPGGISTKATEYKELAAKGDKWESPVFGIGSAKESTGLPKPAEIQRKPHSTTTPQLRDPSSVGASSSTQNGNPTTGGSSGLTLKEGPIGTTTGTTLGQNNPVFSGSA